MSGFFVQQYFGGLACKVSKIQNNSYVPLGAKFRAMTEDKKYEETKQIMLGEAKMNPNFRELADFIDQTFGVKTINIVCDNINRKKRLQLEIYFELEQERSKFRINNEVFKFDRKKQEIIADKFIKTLKEPKIEKGLFSVFTKFRNRKYKPENIFVGYSAFKSEAKMEANKKIPYTQIVQLQEELDCKDLCSISRFFSAPTFFLYTNNQARFYKNSEIRKIWTDKYFELLEPYNDFGYFERDKFEIYLDSKENFENNYESYYK